MHHRPDVGRGDARKVQKFILGVIVCLTVCVLRLHVCDPGAYLMEAPSQKASENCTRAMLCKRGQQGTCITCARIV